MIPPKIFMRMTDLLVEDARQMKAGRRDAEKELDALQDQFGWPQHASKEQRAEWNSLYGRIDS